MVICDVPAGKSGQQGRRRQCVCAALCTLVCKRLDSQATLGILTPWLRIPSMFTTRWSLFMAMVSKVAVWGRPQRHVDMEYVITYILNPAQPRRPPASATRQSSRPSKRGLEGLQRSTPGLQVPPDRILIRRIHSASQG
jgi:hypothetical protein